MMLINIKLGMEKEQADKQNSKSDVLDDPVRMYLKQNGTSSFTLHENKKLKSRNWR